LDKRTRQSRASAYSGHRAGANYLALQGSNASLGVAVNNLNTSGAIAEFLSNTVGEAFIYNNGAYSQVSDRREKKNIRPLTSGLADVMRLKPVHFEWKKGGSSDIGFISQDVMKVLPTTVRLQHAKDPKKSRYMLQYNALIPVLTRAIQEQQAEIKSLESRLIELLSRRGS
jgi:hypothetical protein